MNTIIIVVVTIGLLVFPLDARAVAAVPKGVVPEQAPLQPIPESMKPNLSKNIDAVREEVAPPPSTEEGEHGGKLPATSEIEGSQSSVGFESTQHTSGSSTRNWIVLLAVLIVSVVGGILFWNRKSQ